MSFLFKAPKQTTESKPLLLPGMERLTGPLIDTALNRLNEGHTPYAGPRVAPFSETQLQGLDAIKAYANDSTGFMDQMNEAMGVARGINTSYTPSSVFAREIGPIDQSLSQIGPISQVSSNDISEMKFSGNEIGKRMDPFMDMVVNRALATHDRFSGQERARLNAKLAGRKSFGSRAVLAEAEQDRNLSDVRLNTQAQLLSQGYGQALGQFNTDAARNLDALKSNQQSGLQAQIANQRTEYQRKLAEQQGRLSIAGLNLQGQTSNAANDIAARTANQQAGLTANAQNTSAASTQAGLMSSLAGAQRTAEGENAQTLMNAGNIEQQQAQRYMDDSYQRYVDQQEDERTRMLDTASILYGAPTGSVTRGPHGASPLSQIAGATAAVVGAANVKDGGHIRAVVNRANGGVSNIQSLGDDDLRKLLNKGGGDGYDFDEVVNEIERRRGAPPIPAMQNAVVNSNPMEAIRAEYAPEQRVESQKLGDQALLMSMLSQQGPQGQVGITDVIPGRPDMPGRPGPIPSPAPKTPLMAQLAPPGSEAPELRPPPVPGMTNSPNQPKSIQLASADPDLSGVPGLTDNGGPAPDMNAVGGPAAPSPAGKPSALMSLLTSRMNSGDPERDKWYALMIAGAQMANTEGSFLQGLAAGGGSYAETMVDMNRNRETAEERLAAATDENNLRLNEEKMKEARLKLDEERLGIEKTRDERLADLDEKKLSLSEAQLENERQKIRLDAEKHTEDVKRNEAYIDYLQATSSGSYNIEATDDDGNLVLINGKNGEKKVFEGLSSDDVRDTALIRNTNFYKSSDEETRGVIDKLIGEERSKRNANTQEMRMQWDILKESMQQATDLLQGGNLSAEQISSTQQRIGFIQQQLNEMAPAMNAMQGLNIPSPGAIGEEQGSWQEYSPLTAEQAASLKEATQIDFQEGDVPEYNAETGTYRKKAK